MQRILTLSKNLWKGMSSTKSSRNAYDSNFAALFYIKNTSLELDKELGEVLLILKKLENINGKSKIVFKNIDPAHKVKSWEPFLNNADVYYSQISEQFTYLKENLIDKAVFNDFVFWQQIDYCLEIITLQYIDLEKIAVEFLTDKEKMYWINCVYNLQNENFEVLLSRISICRQQFDFIKKYTPNKKNGIMQKMIKNIPENYSLDEARKYESENSYKWKKVF